MIATILMDSSKIYNCVPRGLIVAKFEAYGLDNPVGIYLFKVNNRNTRARCEICLQLTIKTPERRLALFWCLHC